MTSWVKYGTALADVLLAVGSIERRLIDLAVKRVNAIGHAEFTSGELARLLTVMNPLTGEVVTTVSDRAVRKAVRTLKEHGVIEKDSSTLCLHFPADHLSNGTGTRGCRYHGIGARTRRRR
ncbi:hypothetical protein [Jiangella asiatica]|uniref:Uncharacterized protein n=1 Tax=Jiangella asiatica TaxID=2530372 RepID=A0A4R5DCF8_9ACTN|nr:hypothetical protein [Jiangella asiatica]TDE10657.1 hypothetical protein E1269_11325 [Jiangella asiatica]